MEVNILTTFIVSAKPLLLILFSISNIKLQTYFTCIMPEVTFKDKCVPFANYQMDLKLYPFSKLVFYCHYNKLHTKFGGLKHPKDLYYRSGGQKSKMSLKGLNSIWRQVWFLLEVSGGESVT